MNKEDLKEAGQSAGSTGVQGEIGQRQAARAQAQADAQSQKKSQFQNQSQDQSQTTPSGNSEGESREETSKAQSSAWAAFRSESEREKQRSAAEERAREMGSLQKDNFNVGNDARLHRTLKKTHRKSEEERASQLAKEVNLPYLDLNIFPIDQENVKLVPKEKAKDLKLSVIYKKGKKVKVAIANPEDMAARSFLETLQSENGYDLEVYVVSLSSLERAWEGYDKIKLIDKFDYLRMGLSGDDLAEFEKNLQGLVDLEKRISEIPTTEVFNMVVAGAMKLDASDIHFEPQKNEKVRLRYRIDGVLQDVAEFPIRTYSSIVSRVKVLAKMMLNVHDAAQDGRFSVRLDKDEDMGVRVSIIPGSFGESIVMRLLNQKMDDLELSKLGLQGINHEWLMDQTEKKQGLIINSGPTGSGKTTTLYSIIKHLNTPERKIISIEDPVEYQIPGVSQTQVNEEEGYTFQEGLRAVVRQDPDVILVGEIRDEETAETAIHSALTGHLVLSTIHANSAAGVVGRILDLGVKPSLIGPAANVFIAQRLLRKLCPHCKEKYEPAQETVDIIKKMLSLISPHSKVEVPKDIEALWRPKGCPKCRGLGYKGRVGIFEILKVDSDVKELIENLASEDEIRNVALEKGMITLEQDGMLKSIAGETSLEELQRVAGKGDYLIEIYNKLMIQSLAGGIFLEEKYFNNLQQVIKNRPLMSKVLSKLKSTGMLKGIMTGGVLMKAGDIHIEPGDKEFKVRYRVDGVLHDIVSLPMGDFLSLVNEIKSLAGFKTESREGVIDGRFRLVLPESLHQKIGEKIDIRLSIILGGFGDIIVMRLLRSDSLKPKLENLEIHTLSLERIKKNIARPNGIVINTGPTGSGKTTTLYSILGHLNRPELKIITVEDPIEYQMDGIIQTQVNDKEGYTFATAMRSLLRQNPDIMMIGEIRDEETAQIAYQAALTGHLVLSTLHTNSAAGSFQRLLNMNMNISDLSSGTNCFMAQRLIRKICPHCKQKKSLKGEDRELLEQIVKSISPKTNLNPDIPSEIYYPGGCDKCYNLGYNGRVPVVEVLEVGEAMEKVLSGMPTTREIEDQAVELGMLTMTQDGILKVIEGVTSLEEVSRISREF
jgi:type II secretory ATPase GspE/PulE/Tfp pilus assembly ATPase PilB-like protein